MTGTDRRAVRLRIRGRVQGVWFRGWTVDLATELGLDGWVRNRRDGSVEAIAAGPADAISRFIEACHEGPSMAWVASVEVADTADPRTQGYRQEASL